MLFQNELLILTSVSGDRLHENEEQVAFNARVDKVVTKMPTELAK